MFDLASTYTDYIERLQEDIGPQPLPRLTDEQVGALLSEYFDTHTARDAADTTPDMRVAYDDRLEDLSLILDNARLGQR